MENIIYNELKIRGFNIDVGIVEFNYRSEEGKSKRIQPAYALPNKEKIEQETRGLNRIKDSFKKIVIVKDSVVPRNDENGILYVGIEEFLLNDKYTN